MEIDRTFSIVLLVLAALALYFTSFYSYLLFHSIIEVTSIIIACSVFLLVWNARFYIEDNYLFLLGIAYLFIAGVDLLHTLSYQGMGFFPDNSNVPTQLWILARYTESISLLIATFYVKRRLDIYLTFLIYALVTVFFLGTIFIWGIFPNCYIKGSGLTPFKIISEYIIAFILLFTMIRLYRIRGDFDKSVFNLLEFSIGITILAELAFTRYISVFGISNLIGHYLKLASFYLIYKAIIETGLVKPYALLFKNLKHREEIYKESAERLEIEVQERMKVEEQLEKSHLEINQIFNGAADGIRVVDTDFNVLRVNESFLDFVGMDVFSAYRLKCHELFFGSECHTDACTLKLILNGSERVEREITKTSPDGTNFMVHMTAKPYRDIKGELLGIIESYNDISRSKEMEKIIKEERDLFMEGFVVIFKWINQAGWPVEYVSPNIKRVLGYSVEEITSKDFLYTDIIEKRDLNRVVRKKMQAIENGLNHEQFDPYQIRDAKGKNRWIMDHTRFVKNEAGEVEYFYGYLLDVSNYKATEERLENQAKLAHAGRLTSLGEMASGMAHELNQPLTVIRLAADGLKSLLPASESQAAVTEAINDIIDQVKRAAKIIKNMKAFSRTETEGYQPVQISKPIENAISYFREQFRTHRINLDIAISENLPDVMLDPQKFEQIVVNFLSNARYSVEAKNEYAGRDYVMVVQIRAYLSETGNQIYFEVEDNGISMSQETADRCLEPFFTKKNIGEGTGLGLSIVNNIVKEFGMTIDIDRLKGDGCLFRIGIPIPDQK